MRICKFLVALLLITLMAGLSLPVQAAAADLPDAGKTASLTITYLNNGTALKSAAFEVYRIAEMDANGNFAAVAPFKEYTVNMNPTADSDWITLAGTLEGYVQRDKVIPTANGKTDPSGVMELTHLKQGLYLVIGHRHTQDGYIYETAPFVIHLPTRSEETGEWIYDTEVMPKHDVTPEDEDAKPVTRKVLKVWADTDHENERPKEITVQLLRDGDVYDTVILKAENNWRYEWTELDGKARWTIVEKENSNYTVAISQEGVTFVVTNTYVPPVTPTPSPSPTPPPTQPPRTPPNLPQTGQLWWPVPTLIMAGLFLVVLGLIRRKDA